MELLPSKILSLNIRSGGGDRVASIWQFIEHHKPDVVVLSEWREGKGGQEFLQLFKENGFNCLTLNDGTTRNGVLVAARELFEASSMTPRNSTPGVLLLLRFARWVLLACYFPQLEAKLEFFNACKKTASLHSNIPFILIGDLNTGNQVLDKALGATPFSCSNAFNSLTSEAHLSDLWRSSNGIELCDWTWLSSSKNGFRIDHAFANNHFVSQMAPLCAYDHNSRLSGITDHSAIIVSRQR